MGRADFLALGSWNVACSMCGRKRKAYEVVRNWMGQWRCPEHNEPEQPQDFVRGVQDVQTVPFSQPEQNSFVVFCTPAGVTMIVGVGVVGCMIVGFISPSYYPGEPGS